MKRLNGTDGANSMIIIYILHHSISPFVGQYPEGDPLHYNTGLTMKYARAIRACHPDLVLECWRPEHTTSQVYVWRDETSITHRVFPSIYGRYNFEYSRPMLRAIQAQSAQNETFFLVQGSYNLHAYLMAPLLAKSPVILQSHGGFPARVLFQRNRHRWARYIYLFLHPLERHFLPQYPHIFGISREECGYLKTLCPLSTVRFSPTGIDFDKFSPGDREVARRTCGLAQEERILLYVGRLAAEKGLEYLLDAFSKLRIALHPTTRLVIVGDGPLKASLLQQAQTQGLSQRITFTGTLPVDQLPHWYRAADLTVMPSLLEWFGAVAVESLACGTPIVGTHAGGLVDIVKEFDCGMLVPPRDSNALASAIIETLERRHSLKPNIARGRAAFDWSVKIETMFKLWRSMI
jgi:glycosyltransferase involved in cell wall biosynthesis